MTLPPNGTTLVEYDPWLEPYTSNLIQRYQRYQQSLANITNSVGEIEQMANGHKYYGLNPGLKDGQSGIWYREWAPNATHLSLIGDFNKWNPRPHQMTKDRFGVWEIFIPDQDGKPAIQSGSKLKVQVTANNQINDKIPAYINQVTLDQDQHFVGAFHTNNYKWKHQAPPSPDTLRIYETHIGMAQEKEGIGTYHQFQTNILPRIGDLGYNTIQIMAIMQHPYYGSFGYQVSNFFAPSHYFGTPDELRSLIDTAHGMGITVLMDLVHSHAVKNVHEGLNLFDGTDYLYFHAGDAGNHPAWDTKLFNYGKFEVQRFLLSNLRYWMEEFKFDGFRFDGITSMLYKDHGFREFNHYDNYFNDNVDNDAITYLQLANQLIHQLNPDAITIAEDVSGMPGLARPVTEGGLGFDYRLAMGLPDLWVKLLKERTDQQWPINDIYQTLVNRRYKEAHVAYVESHDQALVGDKTIAFWLMDQNMYHSMSVDSQDPVIDRGIALHKILRLLTYFAGGEAWMNFMGNEFGHPEWIDFPREGNDFSYQYARRQWSLVDNPKLRYHHLNNFDQALQHLEQTSKILKNEHISCLESDEADKILAIQRGPFICIANLHPETSYTDYRIGIPNQNRHQIVLNTDATSFGGFNRIDQDITYPAQQRAHNSQPHSLQLYIPSRTGIILTGIQKS